VDAPLEIKEKKKKTKQNEKKKRQQQKQKRKCSAFISGLDFPGDFLKAFSG